MLIYIYRCMCIFSSTCNFKIEMWSFILVFLALLIRDVLFSHLVLHFYTYTGADPGECTPGAPPLKLEKIRFFWRKIVIFHTKYPNNFRASLRSAQFFKLRPPLPQHEILDPPLSVVCFLFLFYSNMS